jgi:DNA-binding NarL/FixJ family response regulator
MSDQNRCIKIILADDHTIVRQGLAKLLEGEACFQIVGEAENGREVVSQVEVLRPDVVIMDIAMPILNGIEATRQIVRCFPETKVIILSMYSNDRYIDEVLRLGAFGYLLKDSSGTDIVKAIYSVMQGNIFLSPTISKKVVEDFVSFKKKSLEQNLYNKLTNREREVLQLIAEGYSTKEIADILYVSSSTVKTHRNHLMDKLHLYKNFQLIHFAIQLGIVELQAKI